MLGKPLYLHIAIVSIHIHITLARAQICGLSSCVSLYARRFNYCILLQIRIVVGSQIRCVTAKLHNRHGVEDGILLQFFFFYGYVISGVFSLIFYSLRLSVAPHVLFDNAVLSGSGLPGTARASDKTPPRLIIRTVETTRGLHGHYRP